MLARTYKTPELQASMIKTLYSYASEETLVPKYCLKLIFDQ